MGFISENGIEEYVIPIRTAIEMPEHVDFQQKEELRRMADNLFPALDPCFMHKPATVSFAIHNLDYGKKVTAYFTPPYFALTSPDDERIGFSPCICFLKSEAEENEIFPDINTYKKTIQESMLFKHSRPARLSLQPSTDDIQSSFWYDQLPRAKSGWGNLLVFKHPILSTAPSKTRDAIIEGIEEGSKIFEHDELWFISRASWDRKRPSSCALVAALPHTTYLIGDYEL